MQASVRRHGRSAGALAVLVAVCFLFYCSGPSYIVALVKDLRRPAPPTPSSDLAAASRAMGSLLGRDGARAAPALADDAPREERLRQGLGELEAQLAALDARDRRIRAGFERAEARIAERGLAGEVRERQQEMRARYEAGYAPIAAQVVAVAALAREVDSKLARGLQDAAFDGSERLLEAVGTLREKLADLREGVPHHSPDPEKLPIRPAPETPREPRLDRNEFVEARRAVELAATSDPLPFLLAQADPDQPTAADLAATLDAEFTPAIAELAGSLGHDPLAIFNWVRLNVLFVPTFGSIQGAEGCRLSRECNAHDIASLLVALLRVSGVPARYVLGTVEVSPTLFRSAVGDFDDLDAALRLAASGGIPVTKVLSATQVPVAVRLEHVWVEAFVDYEPGRAASSGAPETWVPLDAALKATESTRPMDLATELGLDPAAAAAASQATGTVGPDGNSVTNLDAAPFASFIGSSQDALLAHLETLPEATTIGEIFGGARVAAAPLAVLPASVPGRILVVGSRLAELNDNLRHRLVLQVLGENGIGEQIRFERPTAALAGHRVTLGFEFAAPTDGATVEAFGGFLQTPPYLVRLRPALLVDGQSVGLGLAGVMGSAVTVRATFSEPSGLVDRVEHVVSRGSWSALALDLQRSSEEGVESRRAGYAATMAELDAAHHGNATQDIDADRVFGEILHLHGLSYFAQVEGFARIAAAQANLAVVRRPAEGLVTYGPSFAYSFGSPVEVSTTGMSIDVQRVVSSVVSRTGDRDAEVEHHRAIGHFASAAEHMLFETTLRAESVSAVKLLAEANSRGIPVFTVTAANVASVLPQLTLPPAVVADVSSSVAAGKIVHVPRDQVPVLDWQGVGYIVLDPLTGAGGYLISGGLAGGATASSGGDDPLGQLDNWLDGLGAVGDLLKAAVRFFRIAGKATSGLNPILIIIDVIAAAVAALIVWRRTGDPWRTAGAFVLSLLLNFVVGWIVNAVLAAPIPIYLKIFGVIAIVALSVYLENLMIDWLSSRVSPEWLRRLRRRLEPFVDVEPLEWVLDSHLGLRWAPA